MPEPGTTLRSLGLIRHYGLKVAKNRFNLLRAGITARWAKAEPNSLRLVQKAIGTKAAVKEPPLPDYGSVVEVDGFSMRIDPRMAEANIRKLMAGRHVLHERRILDTVLEPCDRVMELGGGIGMVAIAAARVVGSENVVSYEANPALESLIRENYALNGVEPTLKMAMVGAERGSRTFHVAKKFSRSSVYQPEEETEPVEVPVLPFNEELAEARPNVLIVDIQGAEVELIDYADLSGIEKLAIEFHPSMVGVRKILQMRRKLTDLHGFREVARFGNSFVYRRRLG